MTPSTAGSTRLSTRSDALAISVDTKRPTTEREAIRLLVECVPSLRPLYEEHVALYEELLPHLLFEGSFTRWFCAEVRLGESLQSPMRFAQTVELLMDTTTEPPGHDRVWNLAAIAFVASLADGREYDVIQRAQEWFGPNIRRHMRLWPEAEEFLA